MPMACATTSCSSRPIRARSSATAASARASRSRSMAAARCSRAVSRSRRMRRARPASHAPPRSDDRPDEVADVEPCIGIPQDGEGDEAADARPLPRAPRHRACEEPTENRMTIRAIVSAGVPSSPPDPVTMRVGKASASPSQGMRAPPRDRDGHRGPERCRDPPAGRPSAPDRRRSSRAAARSRSGYATDRTIASATSPPDLRDLRRLHARRLAHGLLVGFTRSGEAARTRRPLPGRPRNGSCD